MPARKAKKSSDGVGTLDGGAGRGVPMDEDDDLITVDDDPEMFGLEDDENGPDRRRDPLRK